ncbi:MAG: AraC family transcriptional regulator ligand-binding domain-containing protein [Pseudomonadota bacterium]
MPATVSNFPKVLIRARALTGFRALVREHDGDWAALLDAAAIPACALDAPDTLLCLDSVMLLLTTSASRLGVPDFGLQLAQKQDIGVLGPVALIAHHAATLGAALTAVARNMPYHCPGLQMKVEADAARAELTHCRFEFNGGTPQTRRHIVELCLGVAQRFFLEVSGEDGRDWRIDFRHDGPMPLADYGKYFRGEVRLGQARNGLSFPSSLLDVAIPSGDAPMQAAAERHVGNIMRRFPLDLPQQVETVVSRHLADGGSSLVQIALHMGIHERTLQRRLKEHGVVFEDIVDRVRRSRAEHYLAQSGMPLAELAAMLGYTEQSSFIRGCRRWFGTTPQAYRALRFGAMA